MFCSKGCSIYCYSPSSRRRMRSNAPQLWFFWRNTARALFGTRSSALGSKSHALTMELLIFELPDCWTARMTSPESLSVSLHVVQVFICWTGIGIFSRTSQMPPPIFGETAHISRKPVLIWISSVAQRIKCCRRSACGKSILYWRISWDLQWMGKEWPTPWSRRPRGCYWIYHALASTSKIRMHISVLYVSCISGLV